MGSQTVRHDLVTEQHDDIWSLHGRKEFRHIAVVHFEGFCYFPLYTHIHTYTYYYCSVAQSCLTLCHPMDYSIAAFLVLHYLLEFSQTHVPWVDDAIQPSHVLLPTSPALTLFQNSGSFPMSRLFATGGQSIGALASVLPMNIQSWFTLGLTGLISLLSKGLSRVFSTIVRKHQFFGSQPSLWSNFHIHTWLLEKLWLWLYRLLSAKWCLCFLTC